MDVHYHEIENTSIGPVITIVMAQLDVEFRGGDNFLNSSFNIEQFQETLDVFHRLQGDILVFPEYYLPPDRLSEAVELVQHSKELNRIYIIPLSRLDLPEFEQLQGRYKVVSEEVLIEGVYAKKIALNLALILVKDSRADLSILSQFKTLPAIQETKPHRGIYRARYLHIFKVNQSLSFAVPICFSFIGKEYDSVHNLEPLIPHIESGRVDCLFVPQFNPEPLHWTFVEAIDHICNVSNGNTSIFMANAASGIGRSSIVDLFTKRLLTSTYDIKELQHPKYGHLIFVSPFERLFRYRCVLPRYRKDKLSPEFVREVDVDVFLYDKSRKKWLLQTPQIIYPYRSASVYTHIKSSPEVLELLDRSPSDMGYCLDRVCTISRQSELGGTDDWEGLAEQVFSLTEAALVGKLRLRPADLVWILKVVGEYHELIRCNLGACYFYDMMRYVARGISSRPAALVSDYLRMRICSRIEDRQRQDSALRKAREFLSLATDRPEVLCDLGLLLPTVLIESSLIISCFNNTYADMYKYGSHAGAVEARKYNTDESGKQRPVGSLLAEARRQIEAYDLSVTSHQHLHYLDVCCLTSLILGRDKEAERFAQRMRELDPRRLGDYGCYLTSKHNETLLLQICGEKEQAESQYLELIQEQREHNGSSSPITVRNLSALLRDKEVARYLLDVADYGNPQRAHREISRMKALRLYRFGKDALKRMCK